MGMSLTLQHEDGMAEANPEDEWGLYQAASLSRYTLFTEGGDPRPKGNGEASNGKYRRLELQKEDVANVGNERTELGANTRTNGSEGGEGTFMVFPESTDVWEIWYSLRLPESFPLSNENWQVVSQFKQAQDYKSDNEGHVILELEARENQFQIITFDHIEGNELWTCPAVKERWVRFRWVVVFHSNPEIGSVRLQVDDREGEPEDFSPQHDSGTIAQQTLATAKEAGYGLEVNDAIPAHERLGIYRNSVINVTTSIDVGNVQTYKQLTNTQHAAPQAGSDAWTAVGKAHAWETLADASDETLAKAALA